MGSLSSFAVTSVLLLASSHVWALPSPKDAQEKPPPGILRLPIKLFDSLPSSHITKREESADLSLLKGGIPDVTVEVEVGTPEAGKPQQKVRLTLDTGSVPTWMNPVCAESMYPKQCEAFGHFDETLSSSFKLTGLPDGYVEYAASQTSANFRRVTDNLKIGSAVLKNEQFGLAKTSKRTHIGTLGVAIPLGDDREKSPSIIASLASQDVIQTRAFSVDIGHLNTESPLGGSVIFGGIDTKRYSGKLQKLSLKIRNYNADPVLYMVDMDSISITKGSGQSDIAIATKDMTATLDTGTNMIYLPQWIFEEVLQLFPGAVDTGKYFNVPCANSQSTGVLNMHFKDVVINNHLRELILNPRNEVDGECPLLIKPTDSSDAILGSPFFRSAFVAFDQDNSEVYVAKTAYCGSNTRAISDSFDDDDSVFDLPGECSE